MKIVKGMIFYTSYYIVGYIIFNILFSLTQMIIVYNLGMKENFMKIILNSFKSNLIVYTSLFIIVLLINLAYNIILTKKLNERLKNIKKEGGENEK